ncbi:type VI secretion system membrane subunit TssM [Marinomonas mediterranea]|jgi:type VI secretion protein IcmF|uniref:Type VI secretion protein IcmF n=1 Tax=Marinomonas mediterranea (strain ATCC 700492 / JCM 21426 / NBRC 103028 / MMB-1) TaxID=717774 RepID=F2JVZ8_MARM1|nr:type VI secretion system membrane subunit TssM [Marinomonas mediterranea]ADZ92886.1 type VI secretion protein IcmF [Marinomonas mediterranea MMB-1]WCN10819.1 type VI secretion system membrane subunit TssM [Marinomonas mediterranea]WCN14876.1 type VI secretion system membrane subunit TssM [Marinomonas mediterranea]WCN18908.1 type VI secretion system membrane subunit TssM [Marinomonas mediterranea MMB-1]
MFKNSIGKLLKGLLLSRLFGMSVGIGAILLLIWVLGGKIGLTSEKLKLQVMAAILACFLLGCLIRKLVFFLRTKKLKSQLDNAGGSESSGLFQDKISDVLKALKSSQLGAQYRGDKALYALPWYMVIGPSGAGKSTLFARSGLDFPLKDDQRFHFQGIGGTRDCDWWFSDKAILIDTAGRYTQDENNDEWINFLRVLKSSRSKAPINGLILALPLDEILTTEREALEAHVKYLKNRLHELISELGVTFPIYIVVTKADKLKGFEAFFDDLSPNETKNPWGIYTLEETENKNVNIAEVVETRLNELYERLLEQTIQKVNLATDTTNKVEAFQFPNQFSGAVDKLNELLRLLFKDNPYHESPWFAGVYFTSGTQEGDTLERSSNALKSVFAKVGRRFSKTKNNEQSYFIDRLFSDVIFPLKDAVRGNRKRQRIGRLAKTATVLSTLTILIFSGIGLFTTYTANQLLISDYEEKVKTLMLRVNDSRSSELDRLNAIVGMYQQYQKLDNIQTYSPLQLVHQYSFVESHGEAIKRLLENTIADTIHQKAVPTLLSSLDEYVTAWPELDAAKRKEIQDDYYVSLKTYLMLTSNQDKFDMAFVSQAIGNLWYRSYEEAEVRLNFKERQALFSDMANLYLSESMSEAGEVRFIGHRDNVSNHESPGYKNPWLLLEPSDGSKDIVATAQAQLTTKADPEALYRRLIAEAKNRFEAVALSDVLSQSGLSVMYSDASVDGIFTQKAWFDYVSERIDEVSDIASKGDWVLGISEADSNDVDESVLLTLRKDIRKRYFHQYTQEWSRFLSSVKVSSFKNLAEATQGLKALGIDHSPWKVLFDRVATEITLVEPEYKVQLLAQFAKDETPEEAPTGLLDNAGNALDQLPIDIPLIPNFEIAATDLLALVQPVKGASANVNLSLYQNAMRALSEEFEYILASADINLEAKSYARSLITGDTAGKRQLYSTWIEVNNILLEMSPRESKALSKPFKAPLSYAWRTILASTRTAIQQDWERRVYGSYLEKVHGRFPFKDNVVDAAPLDVQGLLLPESGDFWMFFKDEIEPFLRYSNNKWRNRTWLKQGLGVNRQFIESLAGAGRISQALFKQGTAEMKMSYAVYPIPVPGVTESLFEVNGEGYRYRNEPQEWREFVWRPVDNQGGAKVRVKTAYEANPELLEESGQWALLRLLKKAIVHHIRGTEFELEWPMNDVSSAELNADFEGDTTANASGTSVKYRIRADREGSVLNTSIIGDFELPKRLFGAR